MNSIDIDVGGTFTDLVLQLDGQMVQRKVPTTPYDLSVCFMNVIEEGARAFGRSVEELLPQLEVTRYSTTVAMNRLIERKGPRLGLVTTHGFEDTILIGKGAQWVDGTRLHERRNVAIQRKPDPLITRAMIVGVRERIDAFGRVIAPLDQEHVREQVNTLIDRGARGFVVSLLWSFVNPAHERRIKEIIREEYKDYHIGYMPVVLAHEVLGKLGEYQRTMTAILDAYLHRSMQIELSAMWDKMRERGYAGPFLMNQNSGGCAEVFKTTASRTYNGGPVAGLMGSYYLARQLGYKNVVATDVGGTSFDIGLVVEQNVRQYDYKPVIDRWMVGITMLQTSSIGAGGGSIAWTNPTVGNRLEVGPQSAGSFPGPACYGLGGTEPTVTDADVVLGYINPEHYSGGRMKLDLNKAHRAIESKIAKPLGLDIAEAATLIRKVGDAKMLSAIRKEVHLRGYHPDEFVLFSYGGGGPTHVAGFKGDIPRAVIFPFSPVFSALGSSMMDILHIYEFSRRMTFMEPRTERLTIDYQAFNGVVESLTERARKDLQGEGFSLDRAVFSLELDMLYGGQVHVKRVASPRLLIRSAEDARAVYVEFEREFSESFSPLVANPQGGVYLDNFVLKASVAMPKLTLPTYELEPADAGHAQLCERKCYWEPLGGYVATPIYRFEALKPGNRVDGPAVLEGDYTTVVIPPTMRFSVETHGLGILEEI